MRYSSFYNFRHQSKKLLKIHSVDSCTLNRTWWLSNVVGHNQVVLLLNYSFNYMFATTICILAESNCYSIQLIVPRCWHQIIEINNSTACSCLIHFIGIDLILMYETLISLKKEIYGL